jgi:hypothetical protein
MASLEHNMSKLKVREKAEKLGVDRAVASHSGGGRRSAKKSFQAVLYPKTASSTTTIAQRMRSLQKSVQNTAGIGRIMENIADIVGSSFNSPMPMPMTSDGSPDWDGPNENSFVMMPINNKKSSLHGRFVILQKLPNGMYKIAEKPSGKKKKTKDDDDDDDGENRDNDEGKVSKGLIPGSRQPRKDKGASHHWSPKGASSRGARSAGRSPKGSKSGAL